MPSLTADERRRIHASLFRKLQQLDPENIRAVGLGQALKGEQLDPSRPLTACIYVGTKRKRPPRRRAIPREVVVKLKRGNRFEKLVLPTDVIPIGDILASAQYYEYRGNEFVIAARIQWTTPANAGTRLGHLTVGHPFLDEPPAKPESDEKGIAEDELVLLTRARHKSRFDAAVVLLPADSAELPIGRDWPTAAVASLESLGDSLGQAAHAQRPEGGVPLRIQAFLPRLRVPGVGNLVNVVSAFAEDGTFEPGTSGTLWWVDGIRAAMQVAAGAPRFSIGFAQALTSTLVWAETALEGLAGSRLGTRVGLVDDLD